jgi:ADP-ribose pyrophosphatase YjhB (NUDIX family)
MSDLHEIQISILKELSVDEKKPFSKLNVLKLDSDLFSYHLRQLVKNNFVTKDEGYTLTTVGKKELLAYNNQNQPLQHQRISILLIVKNGERYVVQKRNVAPFKDFWEFPTMKVPYGKSVEESFSLLTETELGLSGKANFLGIVHKTELLNQNLVFDDQYYLVFLIENSKGSLKKTFEEGSNHWLTLNQFKEKKTHFDLEATLDVLNKEAVVSEVAEEVSDY